jgi:hypothetical protein
MNLLTLILLAAVFTTSPAPGTGRFLLDKCEKVVEVKNGKPLKMSEIADLRYCTGYIEGYLRAMEFARGNGWIGTQSICTYPATVGEVAEVVVKWLQTHPYELEDTSGFLLYKILRERYPCRG